MNSEAEAAQIRAKTIRGDVKRYTRDRVHTHSSVLERWDLDYLIETAELLDALAARVAELEDALLPIAKAARRLNNAGHGYPQGRWDDRHETFRFRVGDVRRFATLCPKPEQAPGGAPA